MTSNRSHVSHDVGGDLDYKQGTLMPLREAEWCIDWRGRSGTKTGRERAAMEINWDAVGALAELLGGIGVIITLVYLAQQIRQNTRFVRADMYQRMNDSASSINFDLFSNPEAIEFLATVENSDEELPPPEERRFKLMFNAGLRNTENAYQQFKMGTLTKDQVDMFVVNFNRTRWRKHWNLVKERFDPEFVEFVESYMD